MLARHNRSEHLQRDSVIFVRSESGIRGQGFDARQLTRAKCYFSNAEKVTLSNQVGRTEKVVRATQ